MHTAASCKAISLAALCMYTHRQSAVSVMSRANRYLRISQEDEEELRQLEMEQIAMENGSDL
jgi:hypothetical protein